VTDGLTLRTAEPYDVLLEEAAVEASHYPIELATRKSLCFYQQTKLKSAADKSAHFTFLLIIFFVQAQDCFVPVGCMFIAGSEPVKSCV
jgi:hypothetical protein